MLAAYATAYPRTALLRKSGSEARQSESPHNSLEKTMRQSFDKSIPAWQQRLRVMDKKTPGHKHGTKRRSWKAKEKARRAAEFRKAKNRADKDRYHKKVLAYWRGERDEHPEGKT